MDFESVDQHGHTIRLSDFGDKIIVLYFYPRDNTPGCTKEACSFRDNLQTLMKLGVEVIGVSTNSVESHKRFAEKYNLNFHLIPDTSGKICKMFGVLTDRGTAKRKTFILKNGKIIKEFDKVNVKSHAQDVIDFLDSFNKQ